MKWKASCATRHKRTAEVSLGFSGEHDVIGIDGKEMGLCRWRVYVCRALLRTSTAIRKIGKAFARFGLVAEGRVINALANWIVRQTLWSFFPEDRAKFEKWWSR
jgi:hypothetical protein